MAKRRTRKDKEKTQAKRKQPGSDPSFSVDFNSLSKVRLSKARATKEDFDEIKSFKADLTKVLILTMLAVGLELAMWQIYFK